MCQGQNGLWMAGEDGVVEEWTLSGWKRKFDIHYIVTHLATIVYKNAEYLLVAGHFNGLWVFRDTRLVHKHMTLDWITYLQVQDNAVYLGCQNEFQCLEMNELI